MPLAPDEPHEVAAAEQCDAHQAAAERLRAWIATRPAARVRELAHGYGDVESALIRQHNATRRYVELFVGLQREHAARLLAEDPGLAPELARRLAVEWFVELEAETGADVEFAAVREAVCTIVCTSSAPAKVADLARGRGYVQEAVEDGSAGEGGGRAPARAHHLRASRSSPTARPVP